MLYPLVDKQAEPITEAIAQFVQAFFPPKILQCNNGKEFKGINLYIYILIN